jgi:hypothetical protein
MSLALLQPNYVTQVIQAALEALTVCVQQTGNTCHWQYYSKIT